jgi:hypothetical protein
VILKVASYFLAHIPHFTDTMMGQTLFLAEFVLRGAPH